MNISAQKEKIKKLKFKIKHKLFLIERKWHCHPILSRVHPANTIGRLPLAKRLYRSPFARRFIVAWIIFFLLTPLILLMIKPGTIDAAWYSDTWRFRKMITINSAKVPSTQTDFPVLVSLTDTNLKTHARQDGFDILFTSSDGSTKLSHEIESYASASGTLTAWVKIPSLSSTTDTKIYLYYGNPSATDQQDAANVWDTNFKGVWHMKENPTQTCTGTKEICDSTSNDKDGDANGSMTTNDQIVGRINGSLDFDGNDDYISLGSNALGNLGDSHSISLWIKTTSTALRYVMTEYDGGVCGDMQFIITAAGLLQFSDGQGITRTGTNAINDGNWHLVQAVSGPSAFEFYIDGVLDSSHGDVDWKNSCSDNDVRIGTSIDNISFFAGQIDEVRVSSSIRSADWVTTEYNNQSNPSSFLSLSQPEQKGAPILYWNFDEANGTTVNDSSSNANPGSVDGATWQSKDLCLFDNNCLKFDGLDDKVTRVYSNDTELNPGTASFSVATWFKHPNAVAGTDTLLARSNGAVNGIGYKIYMKSTGVICFGIDDDATTFPDNEACSAKPYTDSFWHHVEAVKSGTSTITLYIDGVQSAQTAVTATGSLSGTSPPFYVGIDGNGSLNPWDGFIDEVKIFDYAKTADQVKADYTAKGSVLGASAVFGPEDADHALHQGLVGYWKMDEASANTCTGGVNDNCDSSGNANDAAYNNNTATSTTAKFNRATTFDGTDDYIQIADSTSLDVTSVTLAAWVNPTALGGTIIQKSTTAGTNGYSMDTSGSKIRYCGSGGCASSTTTLATASWQHIAVTVDATGTKFYLNGILDGQSSANTSVPTNALVLRMGVDSASANDYNGLIDEARVYNRPLSPSEVSRLYDWGPSPVAWWKLDERSGTSALDSSGNNNTGTLTNGPKWATGKLGQALSFDGTNDYVSVANNASLNFGTAIDFSISAWVTKNNTSDQFLVMNGQEEGGVSDGSWYLHATQGVPEMTITSDTWNIYCGIRGTTNIADKKWHHVTAIIYRRASCTTSDILIYVDGVRETTSIIFSGTNTNANVSNNDPLSIGSFNNLGNPNSPWDGSIDDIRVYNYPLTPKQIISAMNADHPAVGSPVGSAIAHYKFDEGYGTTANNSGSQGPILNGTLTNMAAPATVNSGWTNHGKFDKALNFDGVDDYVDAGSSSSIDNIFDGGGVISAWIYPRSNGESLGRIAEKWNVTGWNLLVGSLSEGKLLLSFTYEFDGASSGTWETTNREVPINQWTHIAINYNADATGNDAVIYINGAPVAVTETVTPQGTRVTDAPSTLLIGNRLATDRAFDGQIDEVKIYNYALTADEIKVEYNQGKSIVLGALSTNSDNITATNSAARAYCPPGDTATCNPPVGHWTFDERQGTTANDISGNANTGTLTNGPKWTTGKLGQALSFDGVNDYVSTGVSDFGGGLGLFADSSEQFSVFGWFKFSSSASDGFITRGTNNSANTTFAFGIAGGGQQRPTLALRGTSTALTSVALNDNLWHFIGMTWDGSTAVTYLDGDLTPIQPTVGTASEETPSTFTIGAHNVGGNPFAGSVDDVRVYNYARTPAQIAWDYNQGKPIAHYKLDECQGTTAHDSSGNNNHGTITIGGTGSNTSTGNCSTIDTATAWYNGRNGKYNSSLSFDGTDDYVNIPYSSLLGVTDNVTLSTWIKRADLNQKGILITKTDGVSNWNIEFGVDENNDDKIYLYSEAGTPDILAISTGTVSDTNWHHVLVTKSGATVTFYIDGIPAGTSTVTNAPFTNDSIPFLLGGAGTSLFFDGQMDDARIYNYVLTQAQIRTVYNENAAIRFGPLTGTP